MRTYRSLVALVVLLASPSFAQSQRRDNPTVRETLRWMQTTLESGAGDYSVGHEVRSVRLEDFVGCRVHFSYSTHQEPYINGEPAPEPNKTYHVDYLFGLGDIDPASITFSKGPGLPRLDVPSFLTFSTRNDEKKITVRLPWESEADPEPTETSLILSLDAIDQDYVARFARALKHAVEACGGKPSLFAGFDGQSSDEQAPPAGGGTAARSASRRSDIPAIAKAANGAVVSIIMSDKDGNPIAQGSGFFVSKDGLILTNYHVIAEGSSAIVKLPDGAFYLVDGMLASDKTRDIAVIKANGQNFRTLALGNSDGVQVGQDVVAIGNPLSLESTVSNGIVSGIRTVKEEGGEFLQITAPISPGSSGGPLFNMEGEVIGITTMYLKGGENLNFAIPINDAKSLLLAKSSKVQNFPDESPKTEQPREEGTSAADGGPDPQIASQQFRFYKELLQGKEAAVLRATYACFDDDPSDTFFRIISAHLAEDRQRVFVLVFAYQNGVLDQQSLQAYESKIHWNSSDGTITGTLVTSLKYSDLRHQAIHSTDHVDWSPGQIVIEMAFGGPADPMASDGGYYAMRFVMQRSSLRYIKTFSPRGSTYDGRLKERTLFLRHEAPETGQCVRIPGAQTPEEEFGSVTPVR